MAKVAIDEIIADLPMADIAAKLGVDEGGRVERGERGAAGPARRHGRERHRPGGRGLARAERWFSTTRSSCRAV